MVEIPGYRVVRPIGRGGMATVYLAVQASLEREVALKVLCPPGGLLAADPACSERFLREARLAGSLHHRHIVAVHDVGVHEGCAYLAMEYLPCGSIAPLAGQVDANTALDCIAQIASALDDAHARGIVHRDVKLENILRHEDGSFLLSDFGIARVAGGDSVRTLQGLTVGTPTYMSPERWTSAQFDGRADLYSLGVVLYALLVGRLPFDAEDAVAIGLQHREAPVPLLPPAHAALQPLLDALLAKNPDDRPATGAAVIAAVQRLRHRRAATDLAAVDEPGVPTRPLFGTSALMKLWPSADAPSTSPRTQRTRYAAVAFATALVIGAGYAWYRAPAMTAAAAATSIAVLPFTYVAGDEQSAAIADALADELVTALARYPGVSVVARSSALAKEDRTLDVRELGRKLRVGAVLESSLRREGDDLLLSARLVDARTGFHRWAERYERPSDQLWQLQQDVAARVAATLLGTASTPGPPRAEPGGDAYASYLRGRQLLTMPVSDESLAQAQRWFDAALVAAPTFAPAQAGICQVELRRFELKRAPDAYDRGVAACAQAAAMDPASTDVVIARAELSRLHGDHAEAQAGFTRAGEDPLFAADAMSGLGKTAAAMGDAAGAMRHFERARSLQPSYWRVHADIGQFRLQQSDYPGAIAAYEMAIRLAPNAAPRLYNNLGAAYLLSDDFARAATTYERSLALGRTQTALSNLATARFHLGEYAVAASAYRDALTLAPDDYVLHGNLADVLTLIEPAAAPAHYRRALVLCERFLASRPDSRQAAADLAWYRVNLGEHDAARAFVDAAASLDNRDATFEFKLAQIAARLDQPDRAARHVERALSLGLSPRIVATTPWLAESPRIAGVR